MNDAAMTNTPRPRFDSGFTLIELMIVLSIVAILMMVVAPSFRDSIERNRREGVFTEFSSTIQLARSEAARSNRSAVVCASKDGESCSGSDWATGWIMFLDQDNNQQFDEGAGNDGTLLAVAGALPTGFTLTPTTGEFSEWISFRPTGEVIGNGGGTSGRFMICSPDKDADHAKYLVLTAVGQLRVDKNASDSCP